jgi:hypothetical protein
MESVEACPRPESAAHYGNYVGFNCHAPATYNPLATLFLNTQVCALTRLGIGLGCWAHRITWAVSA